MRKIADLYFRLLRLLIVLCMLGMVVLVFGNVVLRYAFNSGITVSEELSRWFFVWMVFMGALLALKDRAHLGLDAVISRLPALGQRLCLIASHGLMLFVCWLILSGSWQQAAINLDVVAPASGLSMAWFYGAGVMFGASASLVLLYELFLLITNRYHHEQDAEPAAAPAPASQAAADDSHQHRIAGRTL